MDNEPTQVNEHFDEEGAANVPGDASGGEAKADGIAGAGAEDADAAGTNADGEGGQRAAEFEVPAMASKQAEFTVKLQPMVGDDEAVDLGITFEDCKDGAVQVASVNELAFNGFAAEEGDRVLSVEGAAVQTAAAAIAAITSRLESSDNDGPISLTLVRSFSIAAPTVEEAGAAVASAAAVSALLAAEAAAEIDRIISPDFHSEVARMEAPGGASSDRTMGVFRLDLIDVDKYKPGGSVKEEININSKLVQGLGLSIKDGMGQTLVPGFPITHVAPGGAAAQQGSKIEVGDLLLRVNNMSLVGHEFVVAVDMIRELTATSKKNNAQMTIEYIVVQKMFDVTIDRTDPKEPLGCKLRGNLVIAILPGGLAFKSNLQLDHYILSVNGVPTTGMVAADIVELIDKQGLHMVLQTMPMAIVDAQFTGKGTQPEEETRGWDGKLKK